MNQPIPYTIYKQLKLKKMANTTTQQKVTMNAEVKSFMQTITDNETGVVVKNLYFLKIVRGNVTVQINVGEKTYNQIKTLTQEKNEQPNEKKV